MFRKPRDSALATPSVGRPPSPPLTPSSAGIAASSQEGPVTPASSLLMASRIATRSSQGDAKVPMLGRQGPTPTKNGRPKAAGPANGSILSFFKKVDGPTDGSNELLFVEDRSAIDEKRAGALPRSVVYGSPNDGPHKDEVRFNESNAPMKRRRLSNDGDTNEASGKSTESQQMPQRPKECTPPPDEIDDGGKPMTNLEEQQDLPQTDTSQEEKKSKGPFLDDSDSEQDEETVRTQWRERDKAKQLQSPARNEARIPSTDGGPDVFDSGDTETDNGRPPILRRSSTSYVGAADYDEFDGMGDFEDEYEDGDETAERRWMLEQERLERMEAGGHFEGDMDDEDVADPPVDEVQDGGNGAIASCPICSVSFEGVSDQDASVHVNNCLDGNPTPLPACKPTKEDAAGGDPDPSKPQNNTVPKFRRPVRPPKPGQANPFQLGKATGTSSAFSKLMSGHAEDAAWADAAAAEQSSRGKPSYQRMCPFYKILPGFFICVDAFRYGAVQGCNAYFLSHFHSDHYVGLTATWSHGPIYCSRPTANLVKQQLRVDPRFVVPLEFEQKVEVPGTQGVFVTMIPANHCPGSSLYLFEKVVGKGPSPKVQRVLHCGDFRACPSHVEHPLLKPEVRDAITGKTAQQKIDVCYLDTTYLNPKYAFPSQEDVIQACADMCVSLSKTTVDDNDGWEQMKRQRAGATMNKFIQRDAGEEGDAEDAPKEDSKDAKPPSERGSLLVVVGTYSIGKERICLGIARALGSKIYAPAGKQRICAALEDHELNSLLTSDPREAQVHMTPLFEIRAETLCDYLTEFSDRFKRAVGFRPTGWNYRPPGSRFTDSPGVSTVLYSDNWKSSYSMKDLMPQRGSNSQASCFGVPYSEHSSFRELTMFCCALRIDKIIPTVNVGSAKSRERMKAWCERWAMERKKNGLFKVFDDDGKSQWFPGKGTWELRTTL